MAERVRRRYLAKIRRGAYLAFENAVRLHEDSILLYKRKRFASSQLLAALAIEELGKYFVFEDVWWHNHGGGSEWTAEEMVEFVSTFSYSHPLKQRWFAENAYHEAAVTPLMDVLSSGSLEPLKQRSTYVGFPKLKRLAQLDERVNVPARHSKAASRSWITLVNDYFVLIALGTRKGHLVFDIPEIDQWITEPRFEKHFQRLWPRMHRGPKASAARMRREPDEFLE